MLGFIKKDFYMIRHNMKAFLITLVLYVFYSTMFDLDVSFLFILMSLVISMSTFSYDDYNNWHSFACTLPRGKVNVVKSKYIITIGLVVICTFINFLINFGIGINKGSYNFNDSISSIMVVVFVFIFIISVLFPILFKYGSEKGRIAMSIIGLLGAGVVFFITKVMKLEIPLKLMSFIDSYFVLIFIVLSLIMVSFSYFISKKIYLKKEF